MEQLTNSQFLSEIIALIILGIVYVAILVYCAKRNPSGLPQKHKTLRTVLGVLSLLISAFVLVLMMVSLQSGKVNVNPLTELGYNLSRYGTSNPSEIMKETGVGANTVIRSSDVSMVWGYPSKFQYVIRSLVSYFFILLGLGLYLLLFKPSDTTKGRKVIKVIGFVLLWITYSGIPSLHYFDLFEILPIVFVAVLSFLCLFERKKRKDAVTFNGINNNGLTDSIPQKQKQKRCDILYKNHQPFLFALGFIISIPLIALTIVCLSINQKDYKDKWSFDYPWSYKGDLEHTNFQGLPGLYLFSSETGGSISYYKIPQNYNLNKLREWFSDRNEKDETLPYLDSQGYLTYYSLQNHPILKNQEVYYQRYLNTDSSIGDYWAFDLYIIEGNILYRLRTISDIADWEDSDISYFWCNKKMHYLLSSDYKHPINHLNSTKIRVSKDTCYSLIGLCLIFWMVWSIVYYSQKIKELKKLNGVVNKPALRLSRHVFWCTILWFIGGVVIVIVMLIDNIRCCPEDCIPIIAGMVVFTINMFIMKYVTGKIAEQPTEDYLIPRWFKLQNAKILKNMGIVRLFLLFLIWPTFVLIPVPFVGAFAIIYSASVLIVFYLVKIVIYAIKWVITWIISGTNTKVSYKE